HPHRPEERPGAAGWHLAPTPRDTSPSAFAGAAPKPATAQSTVETFGYGCDGAQPLGFAPSSLPVMGTTGTADITNVPNQTASVSIGFTGMPEGVDLCMIGMPGCMLWHSNEDPGFGSSFLSTTSMRFHVEIPEDNSLAGVDMFLQAYSMAPGANALGMVTSNGLKWTLGF
ncbi:MAG: hypothetical protein ACI90M_004046, partial [Candidatus Azotimanducaceae bacterium]